MYNQLHKHIMDHQLHGCTSCELYVVTLANSQQLHTTQGKVRERNSLLNTSTLQIL